MAVQPFDRERKPFSILVNTAPLARFYPAGSDHRRDHLRPPPVSDDTGDPHRSGGDNPSHPDKLPSLDRLEMHRQREDVRDAACGFLRHFKLPNLIQLTVDEDVDEVKSLVMRSGCQLLHLVCSAQSWEPRELRWWLDIFASVVRLEMNVGPQVNVLLTHLLSRRQGGSSPYRVPKLLDLVVTTSTIDIDYELVVALLPARPGCERLRTFRIIIDQRFEKNTRHKRFFRACPGPLAAAQLAAACNFALKFVLRNPHGAEYSMWDKQTGAIVHDTNL
ncbi:hypothetical protein C8R46DRAFT_605090 [Mycena filopes]|nr:hypothetical protein C8R46DRAFT_605090 [Mycena filopes]